LYVTEWSIDRLGVGVLMTTELDARDSERFITAQPDTRPQGAQSLQVE
jgi:hypothetical protein